MTWQSSESVMREFLEGAVALLTGAGPFILSLGVLGALTTAVITAVRDSRKRTADRRRDLASTFIELAVISLEARLFPSSVEAHTADARLVMTAHLLKAELHTSKSAAGIKWIDDVVYRLRFQQPAPSLDTFIEAVAPVLAGWMRKPRSHFTPSGAAF